MNTLNNLKQLIEQIEKENPDLLDVEFRVYTETETDPLFVAIDYSGKFWVTNVEQNDDKKVYKLM